MPQEALARLGQGRLRAHRHHRHGVRPAKLGVPGEDEFVGSGVSYCATCDGNFFRDKDVCVVGGGNTAVADAIYLSRICHKVSIIVRRDVLRATAIYNIKLREFDNVEIIWNTTVEEVIGSDFVVTGIKVKNAITGEEHTIDCAALFVAIGTVPNVEFLGDAVERDATGHIVTNSVGETSVARRLRRRRHPLQEAAADHDGRRRRCQCRRGCGEYLIQHE